MILLFTLGCALQPQPSALIQWRELRYKLSLNAVFESKDCASCIAGLPKREEYDFTWIMELTTARQHRDSSRDLLLRVVSAEGKQKNGSELDLNYNDKPVVLRAFLSGELLKIANAEQVSGVDRHMDVFDLAYPLIFPSPPPLEENGNHFESTGWPINWSPSVNAKHKQNLDWRFVDNLNGRVKLEYGGEWLTNGRWNQFRLNGIGQSSGTLWISPSGGLSLEHHFEWSREICYSNTKKVCQHQAFKGVLERL